MIDQKQTFAVPPEPRMLDPTACTPPPITLAIQDITLDPETKQVTVDVPSVPRLLPEQDTVQKTEGVDPSYLNQPFVGTQADQDMSLMSLPSPDKGASTSIGELSLEGSRTIQKTPVPYVPTYGWTDDREQGLLVPPDLLGERFLQDKPKVSAPIGWGDTTTPTSKSRDHTDILMDLPIIENPDRGARTGLEPPSLPSPPGAPSGGFSWLTQYRDIMVNVQEQITGLFEGLRRSYEATMKQIPVQSFLSPDEVGLP